MFTLYACSVSYSYSALNRTSELNHPLESIQQMLDDVSACITYKIENMKMENKLQSGIDLIYVHIFLPCNCRFLQSSSINKKKLNSPTLNYVSFIDQLDVPKFNYLCTFEKKSNTQALKEITSFLFLTHLPPHTSISLLDLLSIKTLRLKTFHLPKITLLWQPEQCVPEQHIVITTKTLSMTPKINLST